MDKQEYLFSNLSWSKVAELLESPRQTVLLFPIGSTEAHGPHAPLATDMIISMGMCERAATRLRTDPSIQAYILPPLPYGVTRYAGQFPGTIHVSEATLKSVLVDVCTSLIQQRFTCIVFVNNHFEPEHIGAVYGSIKAIRESTGVTVGYLDLTRKERAQHLTEEFRKGECHAGQYETSLVLADMDRAVDSDLMRTLPPKPINLVEVIGEGLKEFRAMGLDRAYTGQPAHATQEEGEATFEVLTSMLVDTVRRVADGSGGCDAPGFYGRPIVGGSKHQER